MDVFAKGFLQGSIPVVVIVGGTHHLVKKFRESKPVLYWGSLAVAAGLTYAVVMNKVPAPFMDAENEMERYIKHRDEILEVKARLLQENEDGELYIDDPEQEAENDAIYEVLSKYYPEDYEAETFGAEGGHKMFMVKEYPHTITKEQHDEIIKLLDEHDPNANIFYVRYGDTMRIMSPHGPLKATFLPTYSAESDQFPSMHYGYDSDAQEKYQEFLDEWDGDDDPPSFEEWEKQLDEYDRKLQEYEGMNPETFENEYLREKEQVAGLDKGERYELYDENKLECDECGAVNKTVGYVEEGYKLCQPCDREMMANQGYEAETFEAQRLTTTCDGCGMEEEGHMDYCSHCDMDFCSSCDHFGDFRVNDVCEDSVRMVIEDSPYIARKGERRLRGYGAETVEEIFRRMENTSAKNRMERDSAERRTNRELRELETNRRLRVLEKKRRLRIQEKEDLRDSKR